MYGQRLSNQSHFDCGTVATIFIIKDPIAIRPSNHTFQQEQSVGAQDLITYKDVIKLKFSASMHIRAHAIYVIILLCSARASPQRLEPLLGDLHPWDVPEHRSRGHLHCSLIWAPGVSCTVQPGSTFIVHYPLFLFLLSPVLLCLLHVSVFD